MTHKLWGGRFKKRSDPRFERFSSSFRWDRKLLPYDLKIDAVHVRALRRCKVLSAVEEKKLLSAIAALCKSYQNGSLRLKEDSEDVHTAVWTKLEQWVGPLADKLHTGRSRNDLVSQSTRLYCKDHAEQILVLAAQFQKAVIQKADAYQGVLIPGMTHLQNAQVLSLGHIFLAYAEMIERSKSTLEAAKVFMDVCVLGSGALAGVTFGLDQKRMARELGLSRVTNNSYDVSGDRDFLLNFLSCLAFFGTQISRIAEDLMIGQLKGFSLVELDQAYCTGSSMMPQKKNADFLELARGAEGVFAGNLIGMMTTLKGLPTSYNRDLQWDKKYIFDSVETCETLLQIFTGIFKTLKINEKRAKELLADESLYATDLADTLVGSGVSFKAAHHQAGQIVSLSEATGIAISKIGLDLLKKIAPRIEGGVYRLFDARHSVRMKKTRGSTHPDEVKKQIKRWKLSLR
ncbi:MAG: argininosuccinate lyase [Candidatus Omnitrophica bacterium CG07_land_8_20_14_0_80_50_8]|nr:MAG: argininosuccinate lyase [Candidatus Omnitrophica bacterium CG07_land_8_20_14_0_80_50_8]